MSENTETVERFVAAVNANDLESALDLMHPDCVYHNIPIDPVQGTDAIRNVVGGFMGMAQKIDWITQSIAESSDGTVLTERLDRFLVGEKWVELPVMGAFECRAGKITAWRDYFDMNQFQSQLPAS